MSASTIKLLLLAPLCLLLAACGKYAGSPMVGVWKTQCGSGSLEVTRELVLREDGSARFRMGYQSKTYSYPGTWAYADDHLSFVDIKGGSTPLNVVSESADQITFATPAGMLISFYRAGDS